MPTSQWRSASIQERCPTGCVAIAIPIGQEKDFRGVIDVVHMRAYEDAGDGSREAEPGADPAGHEDEAATWRELVEAVVEVADDLTVKYLDGEEITADELERRSMPRCSRGEMFRWRAAPRTQPGTHALLDLIVEGVPAPSADVNRRALPATETSCSSASDGDRAYAFKTVADPYVGASASLRVFSGTLTRSRSS